MLNAGMTMDTMQTAMRQQKDNLSRVVDELERIEISGDVERLVLTKRMLKEQAQQAPGAGVDYSKLVSDPEVGPALQDPQVGLGRSQRCDLEEAAHDCSLHTERLDPVSLWHVQRFTTMPSWFTLPPPSSQVLTAYNDVLRDPANVKKYVDNPRIMGLLKKMGLVK